MAVPRNSAFAYELMVHDTVMSTPQTLHQIVVMFHVYVPNNKLIIPGGNKTTTDSFKPLIQVNSVSQQQQSIIHIQVTVSGRASGL